MDHRDAELSDVTVIIRQGQTCGINDTIAKLEAAGLKVDEVDGEVAVEGTIDSAKVHELSKLDCVETVRTTFSYIADYPAGDPRDLDKDEDAITDRD